ncbi:MAG: hypothetical protein JWO89_2744 [Verrucomicrobiaceae bacterium]|nr:hypothetical protein [Verrucomicrobiaceae bacterium]
MIPRFSAIVALSSVCLLTSVSLPAADAITNDPDLPQPLDVSTFQPLLANPPFNRVVDFTESLLLTGVATVGGKPMATLMDKATKKSYVVSEEPNAQGWKLVQALGSNELRLTQIKLMVGPEIVTLRYSESQLNPAKVGSGTVKYPTREEAIRKDQDGKEYVRGSAYLSQADQDRYHNGISREAHDKFRDVIRDNRDKMFQMTDEQRAAFSKKVFDRISADDKGGQKR